jgi:hypothetical protein
MRGTPHLTQPTTDLKLPLEGLEMYSHQPGTGKRSQHPIQSLWPCLSSAQVWDPACTVGSHVHWA